MKRSIAPHDFGMETGELPSPPGVVKATSSKKRTYSFLGWWMGWSVVLTAVGNGCPCCGAPVCVTSGAGTGLLGAVLSWCLINVRKGQSK